MNTSVGIITQARMTSTRLPGKILKTANEKPLLEYHINRLQESGITVYLATTVNDTDDPVFNYASVHGVFCYRGSEDNVLSRYYECAEKYGLETIIRVTSDCPLIDGKLIKKAVEQFLGFNNPDIYLSNVLKRTFPRGFDFEVFSFSALKEAYIKATELSDLEHVTPYINKNKSGKIIFKDIVNESTTDSSNIRITVDTEEDYKLVKILIEKHQADQKTYAEIIQIFEADPALAKINAHIEQKKV